MAKQITQQRYKRQKIKLKNSKKIKTTEKNVWQL